MTTQEAIQFLQKVFAGFEESSLYDDYKVSEGFTDAEYEAAWQALDIAERRLALYPQLVEAVRLALKLIDAPDAPDSGASPVVVLVRQQLRARLAAVDQAEKGAK